MRSLEDHLFSPGPKRILALDGGGVRGVMTCGVLEKLEDALRRRLPEAKRADFRLCDYFDLIGGTSTGAIVATWLALGHTATETRDLYRQFARKVFSNASFRSRVGLTAKFNAARLRGVIDDKLREFVVAKGYPNTYEMTLDDKLVRTGLAIFTKRIDEASPWIVHNNSRGKYWSPRAEPWKSYFAGQDEGTPNSGFSLSGFVQASASAPYYLDPIVHTIAKGKQAPFIDGGVSPHNNPSLYLFMMSTLHWRECPPRMPQAACSPFGFGWPTGEKNLLVVSLGTGLWRKQPEGMFRSLAGHKALHALTTMIDDASNANVAMIQSLARTLRPYWLNHELEDMAGLRVVNEPLLSFLRIEPRLESKFILDLFENGEQGRALAGNLHRLRALDNPAPENLEMLASVGAKLGEKYFGSDEDAYAALPAHFDIA